MFALNQKAKEWLRAAARQWRVDLVRKPRAVLDRPESELQFNIEYVIAHALLANDKLTIVQVGANDGQTHDPINRLLRLNRCHGILVEPNPESFQRLQETYGDCPHLNLCNAAISDKDGTATLYSLNRSAPVPDWMHGLASFSREHVLRHDGYVPNIARFIVESVVECVTFDTLLRRYPVERVDVLQIDTEGFDAEILRLFNVAARKPAIINFEHRHLSEADWNKSIETLIAQGYQIAIVQPDTLAYLPSAVPAHGAGY